MQPTFQQTFMVPGTLAADHVFAVKAPFGMTLVHASISNSSANAPTLDLGSAADADGWKDGFTGGASAACTELAARSDFDGALMDGVSWPHVADGDVYHVTIKDHGSHSANVIVVLTWMPE